MKSVLRSAIDAMFLSLGFELRRVPRQHQWGSEPFADQVALLREKSVKLIVDVGANIGQTTSIYKKLFPDAKIYAFEPLPLAYRSLSSTYETCSNVITRQIAVSDKIGTVKFHVNSSDLTSSMLSVDHRAGDYLDLELLAEKSCIDVKTATVDSICRDELIGHIDILKIDVQGAEGLVIEGSRGMLGSFGIDLLFIETQFAPLYENQTHFSRLHEQLTGVGYRLFGLYNLVTGATTGLLWADAIYVPNSRV